MIQAPQLQYIPAQMPVQQNYQQQGANYPVQYAQPQMPGAIYNYPTASSYMPAQQNYQQPVSYYQPAQPYSNGKSQFNGVNIEILNPQGMAGVPNTTNTMPAQFMPVQQPVIIPQYPTQYPSSQAIIQAPAGAQQIEAQPPQAVPVVPSPSIAPAPVIQTPAANQPVMTEQPAAAQQPAQAAAPVIEQPVSNDPSVSPESFAGKLRTDDLDAQRDAIEEIAQTVKENETAGPVLLDTQIFDALVDIIDKDTSALEGPSPEVIELRQKPQEELSEADKTKAATPSPLEKAEINKQYALYTIAYMQERLNNELEKRNGSALELKDLPCIEKVIDTAKSNPNPMLRIGAIASLSHIARPEYKADLTTIFDLAKADEDQRVQEAANKALEVLNGAAPAEK